MGLSRAAAAALLLVAVVFWANCQLVFQAEPDDPPVSLFFGCYVGQITEPPGGGKLKIILEPAGQGSGLVLSGCLESGAIVATLAASLEENSTRTLLVTAMPTSGTAFSFRLTRLPADRVQATAIDVENINGSPFEAAAALPLCVAGEVVTCAELGLPMAFAN